MAKGPRKVVFDIETKDTFQEAGSGDPAALSLSLVCIYDYATDSFSSFFEEDLPKLWPIIERTDILIGFNSEHFDIPILNKYYPGDLTHIKSLDLMIEMKNALGRRVSLNQIAEATLGTKKLAHGLAAIRWWKEGNLEDLKKYCLEDVRITKEVYEFAKKTKSLKFMESGREAIVKLDTKHWDEKAESALTFSMGF